MYPSRSSNARRNDSQRANVTDRRLLVYRKNRREDLTAATRGSGLDSLSARDLNGWLVVGGGRAHALLDLAGHGQESLLDVGGVLGGGLEEWDAEVVGEVLHPMLVPAIYDSLCCSQGTRFRLRILWCGATVT